MSSSVSALARLKAKLAAPDLPHSTALALIAFRFTSWALTSLLYLFSVPAQAEWLLKPGVILLLFAAAVLSECLLRRAAGDPGAIARLTLGEALALAVLLVPTGGLASPFVWYCLNPLLVSAVHLDTRRIWITAASFTMTALVATMLNPIAQGSPITHRAQSAIAILLVTLTTAIQARLLRRLKAQSSRIEQQSQELARTYLSLDAQGKRLAGLADWQQRAVRCSSLPELAGLLVEYLTRQPGVLWAAALHDDVAQVRVTTGGTLPDIDWRSLWHSAVDGGCMPPPDGIDLVVPVTLDGNRLAALFCVRFESRELPIELRILLEYTSVVAGSLIASERTRGTLNRLASIYTIVEAAGECDDEHELLDLITTRAQELTGADVVKLQPDRECASASLRTDAYPFSCSGDVPLTEGDYGTIVAYKTTPFGIDLDPSRTMAFVGALAGAMLERQRMERMRHRLLVAEEQARIAAEIHDGASQDMFCLVYGLEGAIRSLRNDPRCDVAESLVSLRDVASSVSSEIRSSIQQLRQAASDHSLVGTIRQQLHQLSEAYDLTTDLAVTGSDENLSSAFGRSLERIVHEAASNSARHGKAKRISVQLDLKPQLTIVQIEDDGAGFSGPIPAELENPVVPLGGGMGLRNIAQLAKRFSGSLVISSSPGHGCRLTIKLSDAAWEGGGSDCAADAHR